MAGMREGPWSALSMGKKVALAVGFPIGATVAYVLFHRFRRGGAQKEGTEESRMTIPLEVYRSIVRHQGSFLDLVGQQTGAHLKMLSEPGEKSFACFLLQGSAEQVFLAKCALDKLASDCEVITDVMEVPQTAFGRIIGRGGESLKLICRTSGARVTCPRDRGRNLGEKGKVSIVGTRREVQNAREMIMEKVIENEEVRRRISQSSSLRQKRRPPDPAEVQRSKQAEVLLKKDLHEEESQPSQSKAKSKGLVQVNGTTGIPDSGAVVAEESSSPEEKGDHTPVSPAGVSKFEIPSPDLSFQPDEHLEVYVSAVENPQHFWIQILGVRSLQLDKLTAEMNRFYSTGTPSEQKVQAVVVGDIVAAPYRDHGTWNRARVLGVLESGLVDLYYVDFGDNGELPPESLRRMRSDFLSLPFQAIECSLAGVHPSGETWTEEALNDFDQLTYCAQWKPLLAKLCSYSHSEISSWPSVQLYDNSHGKSPCPIMCIRRWTWVRSSLEGAMQYATRTWVMEGSGVTEMTRVHYRRCWMM
ncbi:tudor and KH domain-containing protein isoform X2 [Megalops cyprinoides]|uniref:tudor and KH domain-containing protein isoform X2 n=1 Tax=Megalops cyprinoides TaxID=118141 RepID=UPI001864B2FA|nr:tudor and KH domain-containing protein isoform X2 [Megalops cyprinoides]